MQLSFGCTLSDRVQALLDGRVEVEGCHLAGEVLEAQSLFRATLREQRFDVSELSMASHIVTTARGDARYIGIPVFLSRAFRHSSIYVRTDRSIEGPEDLRGKRIGLPEYQQTAALWVRGILADHYGIRSEEISWTTGGLHQPNPEDRIPLTLPPAISVTRSPESLDALLARGDLDGLISPVPPRCFREGSAPVRRLFENYHEAEIAYHDATGFFPIMHCLVIRKDLANVYPWLPRVLLDAFTKAKSIALAELSSQGSPKVALPWLEWYQSLTRQLLGHDYWPYGLQANYDELQAMLRYAHQDGLAQSLLKPEDLFHPSTWSA